MNNCKLIKMIKFLIATFIFIACFETINSMSEAQMKSTAKLMRNVCQPKTKITNDQIDKMHNGNFEEDNKVKCYMLCVFKMMKVVNSKDIFDYESALKQIPTLPPKYQEPTKRFMDECRSLLTNDNGCEDSFKMARCMYFKGPEFYFLP